LVLAKNEYNVQMVPVAIEGIMAETGGQGGKLALYIAVRTMLESKGKYSS
jgi:hypothetical protein